MDNLIRHLSNHNFIFKSFKKIDTKDISIRTKIDIFIAVDLKDYYVLVLYKKQKSRFLKSNISSIENILTKTKIYLGHNIKKYIFVLEAPICSKAKNILIKQKWRVINVTL